MAATDRPGVKDMGPTSATGNKRPATLQRGAGFTLIELLITLVIIALIAAIAVPSLRSSPAADLRNSAQMVAAALRQTRIDAMSSGRSLALLVDTEAHTLQQQDRDNPRQLPDDIALVLTTAEQEMLGPDRGGIRFWPDGSATGGRVTLARDQLTLRVDVEWLTGRVRISALDNE